MSRCPISLFFPSFFLVLLSGHSWPYLAANRQPEPIDLPYRQRERHTHSHSHIRRKTHSGETWSQSRFCRIKLDAAVCFFEMHLGRAKKTTWKKKKRENEAGLKRQTEEHLDFISFGIFLRLDRTLTKVVQTLPQSFSSYRVILHATLIVLAYWDALSYHCQLKIQQ